MSAGRTAATSFGMFDINGATYNASTAGARVIAGEQGTGVITVRNGGILNVGSSTNVDLNFNSSNAALSLGNNAASVGIVNLVSGGVINTRSVGSYNPANTTSIFNFNGGSLRPTVATATFMQNLTHAYVYSGNAIINTSAGSATISQKLEAPTGNGVSSASISNGGAGYQGVPVVKITGDGVGATAVATVVNGVVTDITVTNPGVGYTTATATLLTGLYTPTTAAATTLNLTPNASGGLIKNGSNTLTLSGSNSFTGGITVNGGTLASANPGAIPTNSALTVNAAAVNFGGQYQTASGVTGGLTLASLTTTGTASFGLGVGTAGVDQVNVTGVASLGGPASITLTPAAGATLTPGTYNLLTDPNGGLGGVTLTNSSLVTGGVLYTLTYSATATADSVIINPGQVAKLYYTGQGGNDLSTAGAYATDAGGTNPSPIAPVVRHRPGLHRQRQRCHLLRLHRRVGRRQQPGVQHRRAADLRRVRVDHPRGRGQHVHRRHRDRRRRPRRPRLTSASPSSSTPARRSSTTPPTRSPCRGRSPAPTPTPS